MNTKINIQTDIREYEYEYEYSSHTGVGTQRAMPEAQSTWTKRVVAVKINISIASKRHKGKMAARERATDRSCCDVDSWQHQSCVDAEDDRSPCFSSLY